MESLEARATSAEERLAALELKLQALTIGEIWMMGKQSQAATPQQHQNHHYTGQSGEINNDALLKKVQVRTNP